MRKNRASTLSIIICAVMMVSIVLFARSPLGAVSDVHLLYWNDRTWARESRQGIEEIYGVCYVPVTLFNQLDSVYVSTNNTFKTFIIANGDKFLSFDTESDFVLDHEDKRFYLKTFELHDDRYVPAEAVCEFLGLGYEELKSPITGEVAIRITDGNQKNSFSDLIKSKYPAFYETDTSSHKGETAETTETAPPATTPSETTEELPEPLTDRIIYLTVEDCPGEHTEQILELLGEFGFKATFFVTGELMKSEPATLSRILAEGHSIGLHTMEHDVTKLTSADAILADIEAQNELLFALVKQKSHIWRAPNGSAKLTALTLDSAHTIGQLGYVIWDFNIDAGTGIALSERNVTRAAESVIEGIRGQEVPIIRFCEGENTVDVMRLVLEFIAENSEVCEVRTILPAFYEYSNIR